MHKTPLKRLSKTYNQNMAIKIGEYKLSITSGFTVYHVGQGNRKLDSLWQPRIGRLQVVLPNDKTVQLNLTKDGYKEAKNAPV